MSYLRNALVASLALALIGPALPVLAQTPPPDDQDDQTAVEAVVVTGSRIRQGGAQDVNHFRGEAAQARIPMPDTLTPEGLMGDYDIQIPASKRCVQVFCLTGEAMKASVLTRPDDQVVVGLGFDSNIDGATWRRPPLNLVAVVDKSGSMDGEPLQRVRESLEKIVGQLRPGDQISVVLYGDRAHVYLPPTVLTARNKGQVVGQIRAIQSAGSTDMESGLRLGYATAFDSADGFKGVTRVVLFTDEQPNVGATDAESFMGMAKEASKKGVGLTTIGVGVQYDAALATDISSVRGGNLFFLRDKKDVDAVFGEQLDTMVSEVAYDVTVTLTPAKGWTISGVYGVPGELLGRQAEGAVTFTIPTAFLSKNGGAVFVSLAKADSGAYLPAPSLEPGAALVEASLTYVDAGDGRAAADRLTIASPSGQPSDGLKLGAVLIDEFLGLKEATTFYHRDSDEEGAYQSLRRLQGRLAAAGDPRLKPERRLVDGLVYQTALLSGHRGEAPKGMESLGLIGAWEVVRTDGRTAFSRGDRLEILPDNLMRVSLKRADDGDADEEEYQANRDQLMLSERGLVFDYEVKGARLTLADDRSGVLLSLRRVGD